MLRVFNLSLSCVSLLPCCTSPLHVTAVRRAAGFDSIDTLLTRSYSPSLGRLRARLPVSPTPNLATPHDPTLHRGA